MTTAAAIPSAEASVYTALIMGRTATPGPASSSAPAAELVDVSKLYGSSVALRHIHLAIQPGRACLLLGDNGAGKSTLLRILAGLLRPSYGTVHIHGQPPFVVRDCIGYMSHASMLYEEYSAIENLRYYAALYRGIPCLAPAAALRLVGLDPSLERPLRQYSQGMRQRVSLARVMLPQPTLLLLDEPFSNMDRASALQMVSLLGALRDQGAAVLLTTHQRELAEPLADELLLMESGQLRTTQPAHAPRATLPITRQTDPGSHER